MASPPAPRPLPLKRVCVACGLRGQLVAATWVRDADTGMCDGCAASWADAGRGM